MFDIDTMSKDLDVVIRTRRFGTLSTIMGGRMIHKLDIETFLSFKCKRTPIAIATRANVAFVNLEATITEEDVFRQCSPHPDPQVNLRQFEPEFGLGWRGNYREGDVFTDVDLTIMKP